jgi:hypothetical protein
LLLPLFLMQAVVSALKTNSLHVWRAHQATGFTAGAT